MMIANTKMNSLSLEELSGTTYLSSNNESYIEMLFKQYQDNPQQLSSEWQSCFEHMTHGTGLSHVAIIQTYYKVDQQRQALQEKVVNPQIGQIARQAFELIEAFRCYGHLQAKLDPLALTPQPTIAALNKETYGIQASDLQKTIALEGALGFETVTLAILLERLEACYCGAIGFEYQHLLDTEQRRWLIARIEATAVTITSETQRRILQRLVESEGLEKQLGTQFVAQKRFSIEGGDALIPMLDILATQAAGQGVQSLVLGMGHRGRLNVLINFMGKPPGELFKEFEGKQTQEGFSGDVKYHKGFESVLHTPKGTLQASLAYNPSHLEIVDAVVEGIARAKQDQIGQDVAVARQTVLPILMHGDAAFAGQGIVMETLQLSQTKAHGTGGTVHIVSNNQLGFTTNPVKARSSRYCTDIAKSIEAPVFHVNGDDPEAACRVIQLALDFRQQFQKDVVIDLVCYRRYGHNEADEPAATQPLMYKKIKQHPPLWLRYAEQLQAQGIVPLDEAKALMANYRKQVATGQPVAAGVVNTQQAAHTQLTASQDWRATIGPGVSKAQLQQLAAPLTQLPTGMILQPQVAKLITDRQKMIQGEIPINWGTAETLAYATLLTEGFSVRLTGQDCERGTFAHRHAVLHDYQTGAVYMPLASLVKHSGFVTICDSILSEAAVMGFEYGYACTQAKALVIWEAQYGDFVNGAQTVIDQFISAAEQKWGQRSGLVLFLPHGYEGSGPEHSSARPERFLQLCAQDNIQVCIPTTPAQQFHLLRRQLHRDYRKPLIIMTPKSLLRHKQAVSTLTDLAEGRFQPIMMTTEADSAKKIKRVVLCSGKVYYDLIAQQNSDTVFIRLEQLYPFPDDELKIALKSYQSVFNIVWCQEEPQNQGAWQWIQTRLQACLLPQQTLQYAGRPEAASPAAGSPLQHAIEQKALVNAAFNTLRVGDVSK